MNPCLRCCLILCLTAAVVSCRFRTGEPPLFQKIDAGESGISFANTITETDSVNILAYYYCYNGGGVGVGDLNSDGQQDLFFTGNMVSSRLYINKGTLHFTDVTKAAGVTTTDWIMGVSLIDIDNDGRLDIYLNVAGPTRKKPFRNRLFVNKGNDSQGVPRFVELASEYGLADTPFSVQSAFLDYDHDGDLDMYLMTNQVDFIDKNFVAPRTYALTRGATNDRLYQNTGSNSLGHPYFVDVSARAGIAHEGYGLGLAVDDFNADGWPDIYVANDFMTNDHLYINQQNGQFKECSSVSQRHQSYNGMGVDVADMNNDLLPDILVVDMMPATNDRRKTTISGMNYEKFLMETDAGYVAQFMRNTLQLNRGTDGRGVHFSDISQLAGVHATDWSWGPLLADFDNDGLRDVYITNGFAKNITNLDFANYQASESMFGSQASLIKKRQELTTKLKGVKLSAYLFRNRGNLSFSDETTAWGVEQPAYSNGAVYADLDNDGDLDIVTNNINEAAFLFENQASQAATPAHYLTCSLQGSAVNRNGIGANVTIHTKNSSQSARFSPVRGYLSSTSAPVHFGVGTATRIDSLTVDWPDGKRQTLTNIPANQSLALDYRNARLRPTLTAPQSPWFADVTNQYALNYRHVENRYNDFAASPLQIRQYSKGGPGIAVGDDVDNRNGSDFFVGGSVGNPGTLFRQQANGTFRRQPLDPTHTGADDMGALFFDADSDGDQDLYVVSGGSEFKADAVAYQDRLYRNDGHGIFSPAVGALPVMRSSKSCVVGADYDRDGDIDLFVGGRYQPGSYPDAPRSYLLQNNDGTFSDATNRLASELASVGMVSGAVWTDFDADGWPDLIVVGEWMPVTFFRNEHGRLVNVTGKTGLPDSRGWWNSIQSADIDGDGDMDYVVGNMGTNIDYKPSPAEPIDLFVGDFDKNGRVEPLLFCYVQNARHERQSFPFYGRDDLLKQRADLRKRFIDYASYGDATMNAIVSTDAQATARHYAALMFETCIIENKGKGQFSMRSLPAEAQLSSTYGILADDFTGDGHIDLLLSGNSYAGESLFGWQDASLGLLLAGNGHGKFTPLTPKQSGLFLNKDTKGLAMLTTQRHETLLISVANADSLTALRQPRRAAGRGIPVGPLDAVAEVTHHDGHRTRTEIQYGSGYLSQSTRTLTVPETAQSATLIDSRGRRRTVSIN